MNNHTGLLPGGSAPVFGVPHAVLAPVARRRIEMSFVEVETSPKGVDGLLGQVGSVQTQLAPDGVERHQIYCRFELGVRVVTQRRRTVHRQHRDVVGHADIGRIPSGDKLVAIELLDGLDPYVAGFLGGHGITLQIVLGQSARFAH